MKQQKTKQKKKKGLKCNLFEIYYFKIYFGTF